MILDLFLISKKVSHPCLLTLILLLGLLEQLRRSPDTQEFAEKLQLYVSQSGETANEFI